MDLSVIICTYNRCAGLERTLNSLLLQENTEAFSWEIIVVDNNCIDNTSEVVRDFIKNCRQSVRYITEARQGLSYARNTGISAASGRYLLFIDDDEIADRQLVREIYNTFEQYDCQCVGGKIHLNCEVDMPKWLKKELWGFLTYLDYGEDPFEMDEKLYPFGGNMAFSRDVFETVGGFNVNLGRKGNQLFGGEEVDLFRRMLSTGAKAVYQPKAIVYHETGWSRLKKKYFRELQYRYGMQKAWSDDDQNQPSVLGVPFFVLKKLLRSIKNYISVLLSHGWDAAFAKELSVVWFVGYIQCKLDRSLRKGK